MAFKRRLIGDVGILCEACDVMSEDAALSGEKCCAPLTRRPVTFPLSFQRLVQGYEQLPFCYLFCLFALETARFFAVNVQKICNHE